MCKVTFHLKMVRPTRRLIRRICVRLYLLCCAASPVSLRGDYKMKSLPKMNSHMVSMAHGGFCQFFSSIFSFCFMSLCVCMRYNYILRHFLFLSISILAFWSVSAFCIIFFSGISSDDHICIKWHDNIFASLFCCDIWTILLLIAVVNNVAGSVCLPHM